jgi:hypothetical protein
MWKTQKESLKKYYFKKYTLKNDEHFTSPISNINEDAAENDILNRG